jgi:hypothetical protein
MPLVADPAAICWDCLASESRRQAEETSRRFLTDLAALKDVPLDDVPADVLVVGSLS